MTKLRSRPPGQSVDDFVAGEDRPDASEQTITDDAKPWEAPGVRDDVLKLFNVRLPEPYLLKLRYIAEHAPESMQQFCRAVLLPAIDRKIQELG
jgi:hypothetical protein